LSWGKTFFATKSCKLLLQGNDVAIVAKMPCKQLHFSINPSAMTNRWAKQFLQRRTVNITDTKNNHLSNHGKNPVKNSWKEKMT
jgi:hypothetical protein